MFSSFVNSIYMFLYINRFLFAHYFVKYTLILLYLMYICPYSLILESFNIHK